MLATGTADGLRPDVPPDGYALRIWGVADGLPDRSVRSVVQSADGYLWVGTEDGVARFDGLNFTEFRAGVDSSLPNSAIATLAADREGRVYVGTLSGTAVYRQHQWSVLPIGKESMAAMLPDGKGGLYLGGARRGMQHWDGAHLRQWVPVPSTGAERAVAVVMSADGSILIASPGTGIQRLRDGVLHSVIDATTLRAPRVTALLEDRNGSIWAGTPSGVLELRPGERKLHSSEQGFSAHPVRSLLEDRDGVIWLGTEGDGLFRYLNGRFDRVAAALRSAKVWGLYEDLRGHLWVASNGGLAQLRNMALLRNAEQGELDDAEVRALLRDRQGTLWVGTNRTGLFQVLGKRVRTHDAGSGLGAGSVLALAELHGGQGIAVGTRDAGVRLVQGGSTRLMPGTAALAQRSIQTLLQDDQGRLWIGLETAGPLYVLDHGALGTVPLPGARDVPITTGVLLSDGGIFLGTQGDGILQFASGQGEPTLLRQFRARDGLSSDFVLSLHASDDGALWIGTLGGGLNQLAHGKLTRLAGEAGLVGADTINAIVADQLGNLWFCTPRGLIVARQDDLNAAAAGSKSRVRAMRLGRSDGLVSQACVAGAVDQENPNVLHFGTSRGLVHVDATRMELSDSTAPITHLQEVWLNGAPFPRLIEDGVPPGSHRLEFRYTAIDFRSPEEIRFRHQLEGYDGAWVDDGQFRSVAYTNLAPGEYRFRVAARSSYGEFSPEAASLTFRVHPPFYRTWVFYLLLGICVAGLIWLVDYARNYGLRLRNAVLLERNRIAREIHDSLAQGFVGVRLQLEIASQVMAHSPQAALTHLRKAQELADASAEDAHASLWTLRGADRTTRDLATVIERMALALTLNAGIEAQLKLGGETQILPAETFRQVQLFAREAVVNTVRHAAASLLMIEISCNADELTLLVRDNGRGGASDPECARLGLVGMRERAASVRGTLEIDSVVGQGTTITLRVPMRRRKAGGLLV